MSQSELRPYLRRAQVRPMTFYRRSQDQANIFGVKQQKILLNSQVKCNKGHKLIECGRKPKVRCNEYKLSNTQAANRRKQTKSVTNYR